MDGFIAERLQTDGEMVVGVVLRDRRGGLFDRLRAPTRAVVLACGGIGRLYALTAGGGEARGDGVALAARAGAIIADAEFAEFWPLGLDIGLDPAPLASMAVLDAGASIVDRLGRRLPTGAGEANADRRALLAGAVHEAVSKGGAFLDCRGVSTDDLWNRFQSLAAACAAAGYSPLAQPIPIAPAARRHLGGVHVDGGGRTTLDGLWACGEAACTGAAHSGIAGGALGEALALAGRIARDIKGQMPVGAATRWSGSGGHDGLRAHEAEAASLRVLRATMSRHVGVVRDAAGLTEALTTIGRLAEHSPGPFVGNALVAAEIIAAAALRRTESRAPHMRSDHPVRDPAQAKRTFTTLAAATAVRASLAGAGDPPAAMSAA
jgi:L-aspartate oxidase